MNQNKMTDCEIVLGNLPNIGMGNRFQGRLKDEIISLENDCMEIRKIANEIKNIIAIPYDPNDKDYGDPDPSFDFSDIWSNE